MTESVPDPLDTERWARIEALFHEALELPDADRSEFLAERCAGDEKLRLAVERFIAADTDPEALLDRSIESLALPLLTGLDQPASSPPLPAGTIVGRYRTLDLIGEGGMGTVYRAARADGEYEREVALKLVRTGRLQQETERRFRLERQILARLQHPGIATLLDGGVTDDGQPYLAMELVIGEPVTDYAAARSLDTPARVRLALQVIEAVDYAHQNLIVHRDLKPSNILVTSTGQVKLLDFGIARLLEEEQQGGETRTGLLFLTPEYAAPEQIRGEAVTTATDVYALGAMLYELLTGRRPFGRVGRTWKELERVLNEEPPRLSQAVGIDRVTRRALEGDLTTIVQKALRKEPNRRYGSARAFGEDLSRYLEGRPVTATPDSVGYRASKFIRRNRVACALAAVGVFAIGFGVSATAWQARAVRVEAERAEAINGFLLSLFEGADPDLHPGAPVTATELLEAGLDRVDSLRIEPRTRIELLTTMGVLFGKLGHGERADTLLRQAVSISTASLGAEDLATAGAMDALGVRLALTGVFSEAQDLLAQALAVRQAGGADALDVGATQGNLAKAMQQAGHLDDAVAMYQNAIETLDRATEGDSLQFATELMGLAQAYEENQRFEEADVLMRAVHRLREEGEGETPALATAVHNLAHLAGAWKDDVEGAERLYREALSMRRRIFPGGHPEIPLTLQEIARVIELRGRWSEADSLYEEALLEWSDLYGNSHPHLANIRANQANLRYRNGDLDAAATAYEDIVRLYRLQGDATRTSVSIHNLGVIERERGAYASADTLLSDALEMRRSYLDEPHADIGQSLSSQSMLNNLQDRFNEAEALARASLEQYEAVLPAGHSAFVWPRRELGIALVGQGRADEAIPFLQDAADALQEMLNPADPQLARTKLWLGIAQARQGDTDGGAELIESALESLSASLGPGTPDVERARRELARLRS